MNDLNNIKFLHSTIPFKRSTLTFLFLSMLFNVGQPFMIKVNGADAEQTYKPFVDPDTLDRNIPSPDSVIGHVIGDGAVRYDPAVRYLHALSDASKFVTLTPYAESHEGRKLYYLTITSKKNHARLKEIRESNARLSDPRKLRNQDEAQRIVNTLPGIAWLAYAIHGDELSSTDAALQLAYQLAAGKDPATKRIRDELVIHIDPMMNPDGRERILSQYQQLVGKVPNTDYQSMQHQGLWSAGRGNHYLFDLNRDWLMQVHPETRGRVAAMHQWNPHLVIDAHEMGSLDTYLFDPPREPFNVNLSKSIENWRRKFSKDQAQAFDRFGWSYYTREWYEEWYPGYTNAWASLHGAVGLLYEQAGVSGASIKQASGYILSYRESVHHHLVSSLANLETLRANKRKIIEDYYEDRLWAVSESQSGSEVFLFPPLKDQSKQQRFVDLLQRQGIEYGLATGPFDAFDLVDLWGEHIDVKPFSTGTIVVRAAQPHRRLLMAILEFDPHMTDTFLNDERKDLENHKGTRLYDLTSWNIPMAYGMEGYMASSAEDVGLQPFQIPVGASFDAFGDYGVILDGHSSDIYRAIVQLLNRDCKVRIALESFTIEGKSFEAGSVLLRRMENPENVSELLRASLIDLNLDVMSVNTALSDKGPDLGGKRFQLLETPRIAIASQWPISTTSFGAVWHLLDARIGLRVSPINLQYIGRMDLRKYNVLVMPDTWSSDVLAAIFNESVRKKIKRWMQDGGTLIALGGSASFMAGKDRGFSSVKLKQDALEELTIYEEAIKREQDAMHVLVDPEVVWGTGDASKPKNDTSASTSPDKKDGKKDVKALKREDTWQKIFRPQGVIALTTMNAEHWLTFGANDMGREDQEDGSARFPVLLSGTHALMSKYPVQTPVRFAKKDDLRLSGLLWPEARARWEKTAYATVERVGKGQLILFVTDPFVRGYFECTGRLLLNAMLLGPGLGTSQPVPW